MLCRETAALRHVSRFESTARLRSAWTHCSWYIWRAMVLALWYARLLPSRAAQGGGADWRFH